MRPLCTGGSGEADASDPPPTGNGDQTFLHPIRARSTTEASTIDEISVSGRPRSDFAPGDSQRPHPC